MTNDFKDKILKWLTGNYETQTGTNEPQFGDYTVTNNSTRKQIADELETTVSNIRIRGHVSSNEYNTCLLYGLNLATSKTFVGVFDETMTLIQLITTFASGSDLFTILSMQVAEDGRLYGLSQESENGTYTLRVLLFDNIFATGLKDGQYSIILRNDYIIPTQHNFHCISTANSDIIKKAQDEAIYYITGFIDSGGNTYTEVIKFQINVGSANTWDTYTPGNNVFYAQSRFTVLLNKENDAYSYYAYALDVINDKYVVYKIDGSGNITNPSSINLTGDVSFSESQVLALNSSNIYLSVSSSSDYNNSLYKVNGNTLTLLETANWYEDAGGNYLASYYYLQNINNNVFVTKYLPFRFGQQVFFGMIIGNDIYYKTEGQESSILVNTTNFNLFTPYTDTYINNQYNLYNIYINSDFNGEEIGNFLNKLTLVYNFNSYNGLPYEATNSLVPNSSILYDSNDNIIFARNLYNKTVAGQTTTSTVQIPNTLLNNKTIAQSNLIGQTNMELVNDDTEITKNIYEELLINFVNSIIVKNSNNINNVIINNTASNRINNSVSNPSVLDYNNSKIGKYKINYGNGTSVINPIDTNLIYTGISTNYIISIYVPLEYGITSVELLSADETTVYQTIDCSNLENNKYYTINQRMEVV